jgi:hypothetical protein
MEEKTGGGENFLLRPRRTVQHKGVVGDRLADISKGISQILELGAILVHGHVALWSVAELGVKGECATRLVVTEEVVDGGLDLPGRCAGRHDHYWEKAYSRVVTGSGKRKVVTDNRYT